MAPIILVPLAIERRSALEGFSVKLGDDEQIINNTLLEYLKLFFNLSILGIEPIPQDENGIDVRRILSNFREAVKNIKRWDILEKAYITRFSFTKFLMWLDLEKRTEELQRNRVVNHLINTPLEQFGSSKDLPNPNTLDDKYNPNDLFCPLDADSSQLAAVCAADAGKSFVLHGPPGTGKSQTITNIIANMLAKGKSVLFISEKMAALNVVHQRLINCGLGQFCLELHSNKSNKKYVLDQLEKSFQDISAKSSKEWMREADRLATLRKELNEYVRALHRNRETGESVFQGISRLMELREVVHIPLGWPAKKA